MRFLLPLALLLCLTPARCRATVPSFDAGWVVNVNPGDPVESKNNSFGFLDQCLCQDGSQLGVVGGFAYQAGGLPDSLVVRIETVPGTGAAGTQCPAGIMFVLSRLQYSEMLTLPGQRQKAREEYRRKIQRALERGPGYASGLTSDPPRD